jgi:hypothetical protein
MEGGSGKASRLVAASGLPAAIRVADPNDIRKKRLATTATPRKPENVTRRQRSKVIPYETRFRSCGILWRIKNYAGVRPARL